MSTLTGTSLRPWDTAESKAAYWAGAVDALTQAVGLPGCHVRVIHDMLVRAVGFAGANCAEHYCNCTPSDVEREVGWYTLGAAGALSDVIWTLPDSVIDDAPEGLRQLQAAQTRWARLSSDVGDAFARGLGLLL